jgi:DMSO/TMAO reductase YedYZ molybdopterin-dependent catalytic subunit
MTNRRVPFAMFFVATILAMAGLHATGQSVPKPALEPTTATQTAAPGTIQVTGDVAHPLSLNPEELAKLPRQSVRAKGHDGVESQYEGVALIDILAKAGVATGKDLRGPAMALYVVVEAADNYRAVFALAELDQAFTDRVILLADRRDGKALSTKESPFQIIVPGEKKHARWVRQVIRLKVARA